MATIVERAFRFAEGNHKITPELSQLIADSEAKATDQLRAEVTKLWRERDKIKTVETIISLRAEVDAMLREYGNISAMNEALAKERDQLRTELALLREWQREVIQNANAHHAERRDAIARAESAEREAFDWKKIARYETARAERAEAELATERARLDWLEKRGPWESFNKWGETGISLRENIRAAIDAAMKEGAK